MTQKIIKKKFRGRVRLTSKTKKSKRWWCTVLTILVKSKNFLARENKKRRYKIKKNINRENNSDNKKIKDSKLLIKKLNSNIQRIYRLRKSHRA
jgi:hypothetical protein